AVEDRGDVVTHPASPAGTACGRARRRRNSRRAGGNTAASTTSASTMSTRSLGTPVDARYPPPTWSPPNSSATPMATHALLRATKATRRPFHPMLFEIVGVIRYAWLVSTTPPASPAAAPDTRSAMLPRTAARTPTRLAATGLRPSILIRKPHVVRLMAIPMMAASSRARMTALDTLAFGYVPKRGNRAPAGSGFDSVSDAPSAPVSWSSAVVLRAYDNSWKA